MNLKLIPPASPLALCVNWTSRPLQFACALRHFLLLWILGLCVGAPASAALITGTTANGLIYQVNSDQVSIVGYSGTGGEVVIPGTISYSGTDLPVASIGDYAFMDSILTSVTIPDSVTSIGVDAFSWCYGLISITVGGSNLIYSSQDGVLFDKSKTMLLLCPAGKSGIYTIPGSVTSVADSAFEGSSLTNLNIPKSVASIGWNAFAWCFRLMSITVDESNSAYSSQDGVLFDKGKTMLLLCPAGKSGIYTIPGSVNILGDSAFHGCSSLSRVIIPDSVTSIGNFPFGWCSSLISISVDELNPVYSCLDGVLFDKQKATLIACPLGKYGNYMIPDSVTVIGDSAFRGCSKLTRVSIPDSVTSIGDSAFRNCGLTSVSIPGSITNIGNLAFNWCFRLTSVTIPNSVGSISGSAFASCGELRSALFMGDAPTMNEGVFSGAASDFTIYYFNGANGFASPQWITTSGDSYPALNLGDREEGCVQVFIDPPESVSAGAQWRVDGGSWNKAGSFVILAEGSHLLTFKGLRGWKTPASKIFTARGGAPVTINAVYASFAGFANAFTGMLDYGGGLLKLSLARSGRFTGNLVLRGKTYRFRGAFDANGEYEGRIGTPPLDLSLRIDLDQTDSYSMTLTGSVGGVALSAYSTAYSRKQPADCAGKYTLLLQPTSSHAAEAPQGTGFARMTVSPAGSVAVVGKLADNTSFSASGPIVGGSSGNQFFLYHRGIYGGKGLLAGTITLEPLETSDCDGALQWYKPPQKSGNYFKVGFDTDLSLAGARYSNPHEQGLPVPTLTMALVGGGLDTPISESVALSPSNSFTVSGENPAKLKLTLNPGSGVLRGSFIHPATHRPVSFNGVLYHYPFAPTPGAGFFLGPVISGTGSSGDMSLIQ